MDGEAEYNFEELEQHILQARSDDRAERELHLDKAEKNVAELKRIFLEKE